LNSRFRPTTAVVIAAPTAAASTAASAPEDNLWTYRKQEISNRTAHI
jgi:hypothetical protein